MHEPGFVIAGGALAVLLLIYAPILTGVLFYERVQLRRARDHDHLIPPTPRSPRR